MKIQLINLLSFIFLLVSANGAFKSKSKSISNPGRSIPKSMLRSMLHKVSLPRKSTKLFTLFQRLYRYIFYYRLAPVF